MSVLLTLHVLLLLIFVPAGVLKLLGHRYMRKQFRYFEYPYWLAYVAGVVETAASGLLLAGFFHGQLAGLGALVLVPVMIGAAYINFVKQPIAFGIGVLGILAMAAYTARGYLMA